MAESADRAGPRAAEARRPSRGILAILGMAFVARAARDAYGELWTASGINPCALALFPKSYLDRKSRTQQPSSDSVMRDAKVILLFAAAGYVVCYSKQRFMGAPAVPQLDRRQPPSPSIGALLAAGLYGANVAYNVLNKRVLIAYPHPLIVTTMNLCMCSACCILAWLVGVHRFPPKLPRECVRLLPLILFHWAGTLLANVSVSVSNISFTHTVKSAEPVFTAMFAALLLGTSTSPRAWLYLMMVCAGIALASTTELSFTWLGFWAAMASNVTVSLRTVLSKGLIDSHVHDPLSFMMLLHCGAFILSFLAALSLEGGAVFNVFSTPVVASALAIGPLVWVFNVASFLVLSWTDPVAHSMIRALRRPILVVASIVAFGTALSPLNIGGVTVALVGAWLYNNCSSKSDGHFLPSGTSLPVLVPHQWPRV